LDKRSWRQNEKYPDRREGVETPPVSEKSDHFEEAFLLTLARVGGFLTPCQERSWIRVRNASIVGEQHVKP